MSSKVRLLSYKMTHDTGFAPNPFWGYLTMATCKPEFRRSKRIGDWILGFTSKELARRMELPRPALGEEQLVFAMQVGERLSTPGYWQDSRFRRKRPSQAAKATVDRTGDNIYKPLIDNPTEPQHFEQLPNCNHNANNKAHDLHALWVLVSTEFWYFGGASIDLPREIRPSVPVGQSAHGKRTYDDRRIERLLDYLSSYSQGVVAPPHKWDPSDQSWRQQ